MKRMQHKEINNKIAFYLVHLIACCLLLVPAFYNGFGIVNSDFGTYLPSGFKPDMPVDRPITYGILLRVFSLNGLSLWLVLIAQSFFVSNLIIRLTKHVTGYRHYLLFSLIIIAFLSLGTGLSWVVSQLQPDIFTGIALMSAAVLLLANENKTVTVLTGILYFLAVGTHVSHIVLFMLLLLSVAILYRKYIFKERRRKVVMLVVLTITPLVTMLPVFSKSKHMFFMASMLEKGMLKKYLDESCAQKQYKLCSYKDILPASPDDFLWEQSSPAFKEGGWAAVKQEYTAIVDDMLGTPGYKWLYVKRSVDFTLQQLILFNIGSGNIPFDKGTYVYDGIEKYVPGDLISFRSSRQSNKSLLPAIEQPDKLFRWVMVGSFILLSILLIMLYRRIIPALRFFIVLSLACVLINAWDCATFSVLNGRYGCRIMWLIPFCASLLFYVQFIASRKGERHSS